MGIMEVELAPVARILCKLCSRAVERVAMGRFLWGVMGRQTIGQPWRSFKQTGGVDTRLVFFKDCSLTHTWRERNRPDYPSGASDVGASLSYRVKLAGRIVERRKTGPTSTRK